MTKNEMLYIIGDYCSEYEIDITDAEIDEAADILLERFEDQEEYNFRCGIRAVDVDILLDSYFGDWESN